LQPTRKEPAPRNITTTLAQIGADTAIMPKPGKVNGGRASPFRSRSYQRGRMRNSRSNRAPSRLWRWQSTGMPVLLAALTLLPFAVLPAAATGTLVCTIEDRNLSFELFASTSLDDGNIVQVHQGSLKLKPGQVVEKGIGFAFNQDNIYQQWTFADDLRFAIRFADPDNKREIVLAVITVRNDSTAKYLGRYVLDIRGGGPNNVVKGRIKSCDGE
jgi:hypothetical protein